ncbi:MULTISPECIES: hypothetical protein [Mycobacterium]|jgi:predicted HicB family RNase H-like nuclease|uniref:Uncharacterized protein n=4 Tax=Mycobacterium TaxID=1763 RepID=D5P5A3_9MYCO|nr:MULTISPECIES: hypothetical protein [Mycobacterium]AFV14875.1 hypothetical protein OEM_p100950 [Mycobacterium intracellulare subsp. yongonense 05-1390]AGZ54652.1 hypothetical protein MKAN_29600 [Mycobacterium kansasii ATCC 12478]ARV85458.1 hypothetical protein BWK49_28925 [Mycobacterium intracellulare subsp. chimaera]ASX03688.1 hypothetical protein CKJ58_27000 [Mycobacterium intracellulare subsp. chimaera]AXO25837.1 hypothetical protein DFS55_24640 [Mycobacterium avium subsp. hominissuis]
MAPPSKGDRGAHMVKNHPAVTQRLIAMAEEAGSSSMSQYIADVLALYVGLPEHVREFNQLPIAATRKLDGLRGDSRDNRIMTRPHREVSERLARQAAQSGSHRGQVAPYIADVLAVHVGLPEYARTPTCVEEGLPLAM